jgi:hypothetical protein
VEIEPEGDARQFPPLFCALECEETEEECTGGRRRKAVVDISGHRYSLNFAGEVHAIKCGFGACTVSSSN